MNRADIVARITDQVQFLTGTTPYGPSAPLFGYWLDHWDMVDLGMWLEDEFELPADLPPNCTIDTIADLVMAAERGAAV